MTRTASNGRDRLLDAAEAIFAAKGYSGAALREIARTAGVELGLVNYYFKSKEDLFHQTLLRRALEMSQALGRALDCAIAPPRQPTVTDILRAYAEPHLERLGCGDEGWRNYIRLAAQSVLLFGSDARTTPEGLAYEPIMQRFRSALGGVLVDTPDCDMDRGFYLFRMTILSLSSSTTMHEDYGVLGEAMIKIFGRGLIT